MVSSNKQGTTWLQFYLKNLVLMFLVAVPVAAVLSGVLAATLLEDPSNPRAVGTTIGDHLRVLYFWAWPVVGLLSVVQTLALQLTPVSWGLRRSRHRIVLSLGAGLLFGITIGSVSGFSAGGVIRGTIDFVLLSGIYGIVTARLISVPTADRPTLEDTSV